MGISQLQRDTQIVWDDLKKYSGHQESWDWEADLRFAKAIGAITEVEVLEEIMTSDAVLVLKEMAHAIVITKIKRRRLRALNNLRKMGIVNAGWIRSGERGRTLYGVTRFRTWWLISRSLLRPPK